VGLNLLGGLAMRRIFGVLMFLLLCVVAWSAPQDSVRYARESKLLQNMFTKAKDGIVLCYSSVAKTTGFFVSADGWVVTAGHNVDPDFPKVHKIYVKLNRYSDEVYESTEILPRAHGLDLMAFKIDFKPKFFFKQYKKAVWFEECWIFGFRGSSGKVPSNAGYATYRMYDTKYLQTTATAMFGNSGSPVLNYRGEVLGICIMRVYGSNDGVAILSHYIQEYLQEHKIIKK